MASTARSAVTAARVRGSSIASRTSARELRVGGPALDRQRALPGGGEHLQRVEHLGHVVHPSEPGEAGPGQHDRVHLSGDDLADPGVHVATNCHHVETEAERAQLRGPSRRPRADARTGRQLAQGEAVAGDDDVARVLAHGYGGQGDLLVAGWWAGP